MFCADLCYPACEGPYSGNESAVLACLQGTTPLLLAARAGHTDTVAALLRGKANPDVADKQSITPLHVACENGSTEMAKALLEAGGRNGQLDCRGFDPGWLHASSLRLSQCLRPRLVGQPATSQRGP